MRRCPAWLFPALFLGLALCAAATRPLAEPDEGRYGEAAREMLAGGDWLLPRLNGVTYPDKPPGAHWLMAAAMAVFGPSAFAVRLPAWLAYAGLLLLLGRIGRGGPPGFAATAVLIAAASPLCWALGQLATLDMLLGFCVSAGIWFGWRRLQGGGWRSAAAAGAALGYGFLVKGPVAWALPLLILAVTALWERRARALRRLLHPSFLVPLLGIGLPWYWLAWRADPDLLDFWVLRETVDRVASGTHERSQPIWYYPALALAACFPWLLAALLARLRRRPPPPAHPDARLHFVWAWLPVVFFSLPASKQPGYLLPAIPGLALWLAGWWSTGGPARWLRPIAAGLALVYAAATIYLLHPERARSDDPLAAELQAAGAGAWPGGQLMGWSYGLGFRLQRADLQACGPLPPAWRYAADRGRVRTPSAIRERHALAAGLLQRDADGDGVPDPAFLVLHQLEDEPEHLERFTRYCAERAVPLYLWLQLSDQALLANRQRRSAP